MIVTVTPNVAIDRTYFVDHIELGAVHKVSRAVAQIGGKGVNVSRVLACLGYQTLIAGLFGAAGVAAAEHDLRSADLPGDLYGVSGVPRQTVTVTADARSEPTTAFDEPGPTVTEAEWRGCEEHVGRLVESADWVVLAGSLPPGAPASGYRRLVHRAGATILDARGGALLAALAAGPAVVKLNRAELSETLGRACATDAEVIRAARELQSLGAHRVIVTLGADGAIGADKDEVWRISHPAVSGNPIGAGDAFTAGVAATLYRTRPFGEALKEGAAVALASLRSATAGHVERNDVADAHRRISSRVVSVEEQRA